MIGFPWSPAHLGVPSLSKMPGVTPKGGMRDGSTVDEDPVEVELVAAPAGAEEVSVMSVVIVSVTTF